LKFTTVVFIVASVVFLQMSIAAAGPITYLFDGTASGTLGGQTFSDASLRVTAVADTANVPAPVGAESTISFNPASVAIDISAVGTMAVSNAYVFDAQALTGVGFGVVSDDIQIHDPSFATYNMKSAIGPIFEAADPSTADWTNMPTSIGDLTVTSFTNVTFTATLGGSNPSGVPAPSAAGLSLVGLAVSLIVAYRRRLPG